ncbi:MAG: hypothetical protein AAF961_02600 [Planctomycetota bacterium]
MSQRMQRNALGTIVAFLVSLVFVAQGDKVRGASRLPTGPPTNLHRSFVINQTRRRAAQGLPTKRYYGVFIAGGYQQTVNAGKARSYSRQGWRPFRRR